MDQLKNKLGSAAIVLVSEDAGVTWEQQPAADTSGVRDLDFAPADGDLFCQLEIG